MTPAQNTQGIFYKVGGTLEPDDPSYVERPADGELLNAILSGEYCNILAARQMGKSSLMIRTAGQLAKREVHTAAIDLSGIGFKLTAHEWYLGVLLQIRQKMKLDIDEISWWGAQQKLSPVQRFDRFVQERILDKMDGKIAIFVDEIDATLTLPFTDDFFAAIRAMYNKRASESDYRRLTFVLVGVARPADLIKDRTKTPYNIGYTIDLDDFDAQSARKLLPGLQRAYPRQAQNILDRVLHWTGGHPYLTQSVCRAIVESPIGDWTDERVDRLVEDLFFQEGQIRRETNLQRIDDYVRGDEYCHNMLLVYYEILSGKQVKDEERSIEKSRLKLSGLVKANARGYLKVRNHIYARVFGPEWLELTAMESGIRLPKPRKPKGLAIAVDTVRGWFGLGKEDRRR
ncbi:MAG: AAA-like domain-containing protein [Anaerolineae bacterium]|nr:AAA-like domain-containing protein [Anaerolineae bacterium]